MRMKPTIGRIVIYNRPADQTNAAQQCPAVVRSAVINESAPGSPVSGLNLVVFGPQMDERVYAREQGDGPGCWNWPTIIDAPAEQRTSAAR
jgi:hypothetical protein